MKKHILIEVEDKGDDKQLNLKTDMNMWDALSTIEFMKKKMIEQYENKNIKKSPDGQTSYIG